MGKWAKGEAGKRQKSITRLRLSLVPGTLDLLDPGFFTHTHTDTFLATFPLTNRDC